MGGPAVGASFAGSGWSCSALPGRRRAEVEEMMEIDRDETTFGGPLCVSGYRAPPGRKTRTPRMKGNRAPPLPCSNNRASPR